MNEDTESVNVHRDYVNAERGDEGVPDYFLDRIENNPQNDLWKQTVFRELWYSDNTIHSLTSLEAKFDHGRQTIEDRLDDLVEQGVLKKAAMNNGNYWWINFPESEDPLPKDVVVYPLQEQDEEMSVDEFFSQSHVVIGVVALLAVAIGGAMVLFGALQLGSDPPLPVPPERILISGLWALIVSYLFLLVAVVVWVMNQAFDLEDGVQGLFSGNE